MNSLLEKISDEAEKIVNKDLLELVRILISKIDIDMVDFEKTNILIRDKEINIFLASKNAIPLTILLWNNVINFYVSENKYHIYDDVFLKNEIDIKKLQEHISIWFDYDITELQFILHDNVEYIEFSYLSAANKKRIVYTNKNLFTIKEKYLIKEKNYKKWS